MTFVGWHRMGRWIGVREVDLEAGLFAWHTHITSDDTVVPAIWRATRKPGTSDYIPHWVEGWNDGRNNCWLNRWSVFYYFGADILSKPCLTEAYGVVVWPFMSRYRHLYPRLSTGSAFWSWLESRISAGFARGNTSSLIPQRASNTWVLPRLAVQSLDYPRDHKPQTLWQYASLTACERMAYAFVLWLPKTDVQ